MREQKHPQFSICCPLEVERAFWLVNNNEATKTTKPRRQQDNYGRRT